MLHGSHGRRRRRSCETNNILCNWMNKWEWLYVCVCVRPKCLDNKMFVQCCKRPWISIFLAIHFRLFMAWCVYKYLDREIRTFGREKKIKNPFPRNSVFFPSLPLSLSLSAMIRDNANAFIYIFWLYLIDPNIVELWKGHGSNKTIK